MIPKKPDSLFKDVAEELEISEDLVDKFVSFYYKDVRKHLTELNHTRINLDGLGHMVIKTKTVGIMIEKYNRMIAKADTFNFSGYFNKKRLESRIEALNIMQAKINDFNKEKEEFRKKIKDGTKENLEK